MVISGQERRLTAFGHWGERGFSGRGDGGVLELDRGVGRTVVLSSGPFDSVS